MPTKRQEREELLRRQGGVSAFDGNPIRKGARLETHHNKELWEGGSNSKKNKRVMAIEEHLAVHYFRSLDPRRSEEDRKREADTVRGRLKELNPQERRRYEQLIGNGNDYNLMPARRRSR